MKCLNEKCDKNPLDNIYHFHISDGDFVCDEKCKHEYEKQREEFFDNIGNDEWYNNWLNN
jgi:hypothetical protein